MLNGHKFVQVLALAGVTAIAASYSAAAASVTETFANHQADSTKTVDHSGWDKLLKAYVKPGSDGLNRVDYGAFKAKGHSALKAYIKQLEGTKVAGLGKAEQFAFWANLYNAKTVEVILSHYPVKSIRQISIKAGLIGFLKKSVGAGGPWKAKIMSVGGHKLSLDDVEHGILRPIFKDPRIHYAVNCASIGCPNLRTDAYTGANLEAELTAGAVDYINSPRGFDVSGGEVKASSIYSWFQVDFGGSKRAVLAHANKYAKPDLKAKLSKAGTIDDFGYDWNLNDVAK